VNLGLAQYFAVFAGVNIYQSVGSYGALYGALGVQGEVVDDGNFTSNNDIFTNNSITAQVLADITAAMADCSSRPNQLLFDYIVDGGSDDQHNNYNVIYDEVALKPGVYSCDTHVVLKAHASLTLDAAGDSSAVWIFNLHHGIYFYGTVQVVNHPLYPGDGSVPAPVFWNSDGDDVYDGSVVMYNGATVCGTVLSRWTVTLIGSYSSSKWPDNTIVSDGGFLALDDVLFYEFTNTTTRAYTYPNIFPNTHSPSDAPSVAPSALPTSMPSLSLAPSAVPSVAPSTEPSHSMRPTNFPIGMLLLFVFLWIVYSF
jgi:hypothetical protein